MLKPFCRDTIIRFAEIRKPSKSIDHLYLNRKKGGWFPMEERIKVLPESETVSHVSWGSIFAGTIIALIVQVTLVMLGLAVGFGTIQPAVQGGALSGLGIGAAIWWILSSVIALFVGGWVSSRLAGLQRVFDGALHGLATWALVTLLSIYLLTSGIGFVVGGAFGVVKDTLGISAQAAAAALGASEQGGGGNVAQSVRQALTQPGGAGLNQVVISQVMNNTQKILAGTFTAADRENLVTLIMRNSTMNRAQADALVQRIVTTTQQAQQQLQQTQASAAEIAAKAANAMTIAAIASFFMLVLTGVAAGLGGMVGRVKGAVQV
jgi:hypothetical protein